jgi:endonuclease/exonuclease/phosphatase family metal-dependent hydrolase
MIKLVCLNVERSKHLDRIAPFLEEQKPDVLCLQELVEDDIPFFERLAGPCAIYVKNSLHQADPPREGFVIDCDGIFTRLPVIARDSTLYAGITGTVPTQSVDEKGNPLQRPNRWLTRVVVGKAGEQYCIGTVHFTWTPKAAVTDEQRHDMRELLRILSSFDDFVLCGDLNAPRGGEIFAMLAEKYKDDIPERYTTSIDVNLHRAGKIPSEHMDQKMVDGLFSTPEYIVSEVELHIGVSDHMAITATIGKA